MADPLIPQRAPEEGNCVLARVTRVQNVAPNTRPPELGIRARIRRLLRSALRGEPHTRMAAISDRWKRKSANYSLTCWLFGWGRGADGTGKTWLC